MAGMAFAAGIPGDAQRGAAVFETQKCVGCHAVNGKGGSSAPDLGKRTGRDYSPSLLAALMWNHAPAMWAAIGKAGIEKPVLAGQDAADLFAFFYAARYFDRLGDAGRGKQLFVSRSCVDCHNLSSSGSAGASPVVKWASAGDPIELARQMWNHAAPMRAAMAKRKIEWPLLTAQEAADMVVYLQNLPQTKGLEPAYSPASAETGETLFRVKGCVGCHKQASALASRARGRGVADFAAAMWNHAPKMAQSQPELNPVEMRRIVGYLWSVGYFEAPGDAGRGKAVFAKNRCGSCHGAGSKASNLSGHKPFDSFNMVASLWRHGPAMLTEMRGSGQAWPRFQGSQMGDLIAYLNTLN